MNHPRLGLIVPAFQNPPPVCRPLFSSRVRAGFPSPAQDHIERSLDLNELLATGKPSVFYLRLEGDSMVQAGMHEGDLLVVDRALKASHNRIVIAVIDGELTVKRLHLQGKVSDYVVNQVKAAQEASRAEASTNRTNAVQPA